MFEEEGYKQKVIDDYVKVHFPRECAGIEPLTIEDVKQAYQDGIEKANEWHFVKNGDLPKEFDKPYLCKVNEHFEVGYFMAYKEQPWHFDEYYLDNDDVIAWKEIVLPNVQ